MVTILNPFKAHDASPQADSGIPLRMVRNQPERMSADGTAGDGEEDDQPLLHSDGLDLERLRGEIEKELSPSGVDSAYDRMCAIISYFSTTVQHHAYHLLSGRVYAQ
jgi:hypothetical protein